jgi:serine O-acetyltransferase
MPTMFKLFHQDVLRWVDPGTIIEDAEINLYTALKLLWRHMPLRAMFWFRLGSWFKKKGVPAVPGIIQRYLYRFFGLEIVVGDNIGGGLYIPHPIGTVITAEAIGENCSIIASATIGMRNEWEFPTIGNNVFIGAGARVLGKVAIGDNAKIGANAVVLHDVPAGATAVGIPARKIQTEY